MSKEFKKYKLPKSWVWATLGNLGIVASGGTPSTRERRYWDGEIPWITPADLTNYEDKYISGGKRFITEDGLEESSAKLLPKGTLLFSSRAPIGYIAIAKNEIATNQGFKNLIPTESLYVDYIYYYLKSSVQAIKGIASGSTFLELSAQKFTQIPIPIPPIDEQKQIVNKLEEILSEFNNAILTLSIIKKQLEVFRKSILEKTFGKIYEKTYLTDLNSIGNIFTGNTPPKKESKNYFGGTLNFYKPGDLDQGDNTVRSQDKLTKIGYKLARIAPKNSILITCIGATLGKTALIKSEGAFNQQINAIIPTDKTIPKFAYYQIISSRFQESLIKVASSTTLPIVNKSKLSRLEFYLPPIKDQLEIVNELDSYFSLTENLSQIIEDKLIQSDKLRFGLYKKAFSGQLTPSNLEDDTIDNWLKSITKEKEEYLIFQKEKKNIFKNENKRIVMEQTIIDVLKAFNQPISAKEVWERSIHKDDIEAFYAELKKLQGKVEEVEKGMLALVNES